jgi:hypothetical protein
MKVEILEQRQLLAGLFDDGSVLLAGGSANFVNNETEFQGNLYNGFELASSVATFKADPGEITRISFLDPDGDLVFAEISSDSPETSLTISMSNFSSEVASPYTQPGTTYVQGLASFTIENSTALTYFSVFSLGTDANRVDPALFQADDLSFADPANNIAASGIADVQNIIVVPITGRATFIAGINAANANLTSDVGIAGIAADDIRFGAFDAATGAGGLLIGNITPGGTAQAWVRISPFSVLDEIQINGGDLAGVAASGITLDTNMLVWNFAAKDGRLSINGVDAVNDGRDLQVAARGLFDDPANLGTYFITGGQGVSRNSDSQIVFDATDQDQDAFDAFFNGQTFDSDVLIQGVVDPGIDIGADGFNAGLIIEGDFNGASDINISVIAAGSFGNIIIEGDFTNALITTDIITETLPGDDGDLETADDNIVQSNTWQAGEGGIESITITGTVDGEAGFEARSIGGLDIGVNTSVAIASGRNADDTEDDLLAQAPSIINIMGDAANDVTGWIDNINIGGTLNLHGGTDATFLRVWDGWVGTFAVELDLTTDADKALIWLGDSDSTDDNVPYTGALSAGGNVTFKGYAIEIAPSDGDVEATVEIGGISGDSVLFEGAGIVETGQNVDDDGPSATLANLGPMAASGGLDIGAILAGDINNIASVSATDGSLTIASNGAVSIEGDLGPVWTADDNDGADDGESITVSSNVTAANVAGFTSIKDFTSTATIEADAQDDDDNPIGELGTAPFITAEGNVTVNDLNAPTIGMISGFDVTISGAVTGVSIDGFDAENDLSITGAGSVVSNDGADDTTLGSIGSFTAGNDLTIGGNAVDSDGSVGSLSAGNDLTISNSIGAATSIGNISATENATIGADVTAETTIGDISSGDLLTVNAIVWGKEGVGNVSADGGLNFDGQIKGSSIGNITVSDGLVVGADDNIEFFASDGEVGDISITRTAGGNDETLVTDFIVQVQYGGAVGGASADENSIGNISLNFWNPDLEDNGDDPPGDDAGDFTGLSFFASTSPADDADSGVTFTAEGNIGNVTLASNAYTGAENQNVNLLNSTGVLIAAGDGDGGARGGIDTGIGSVSAGGADIGDVSITALLDNFGNDNAAGTGLVIAAGMRPTTEGVYVEASGGVLVPAADKFVGSSIGAVTLVDTSIAAEPSSLQALLAQENITDAGTTVSAPVFIADSIASVDLSSAAGVSLGNDIPDPAEDSLILHVDGNADGAAGATTGDLVIVVV